MPRHFSLPVRLAALLLATVAIAAALGIRSAAAHPLGNFTINRYAQVELGSDSATVLYALDMAEIPTFQELDTVDRNHDGVVSDDERAAYLNKKLPNLAKNVKLTIDGKAVGLHVDSGQLSFGDGQGGLKLLRIDAVFSGAYPSGLPKGALDAQVRDSNYDDRLGWKEIVVQGSGGAAVGKSNAPAAGVSDSLRSYPQDMLASPLNVHSAQFTFEPGVAAAAASAPAPNTAAQVAKRTSRAVSPGVLGQFADSAATKTLTPGVVIFLLLAAVFWGAVHAVGPGHGKTVVAAYLVGSRGTAKHAVLLGTTVTLTHTAGTYALGFITLFASHFIVPEKLYPALTLTSGVLVIGMGVMLLVGRLRATGRWPSRIGLPRVFAPRLRTANALAAAASDSRAAEDRPVWNSHGAATVPFSAGGAAQTFGAAGPTAPVHSHGGRAHSHALPGDDGRPVTWRSLLSLGIYGGIIPCPTAIVVLLTSISLNRIGFGLILVVAFSLGLAAVLTGIGLLLVRAGKLLSRFSEGSVSGRIAAILPVASAAAVIVAGVLITLRAAGTGGIPMV